MSYEICETKIIYDGCASLHCIEDKVTDGRQTVVAMANTRLAIININYRKSQITNRLVIFEKLITNNVDSK